MSTPIGSPRLKGALIYFGAPMIVPVPSVIVFQYNPESMTRTLTPWQPLKAVTKVQAVKNGQTVTTNQDEYDAYQKQLADLSLPFDPQETFSLTLELDATDGLEFPEANPVTVMVGVADRLAAIEMLLYPPEDSALGGLLGSVSVSVSASGVGVSAGASANTKLIRKDAPIVLFFWGPGRILPVRVMSLTIEEQQYSPTLYPTRAKATIGLRVLTKDDLRGVDGNKATGPIVDIAKACYDFTNGQKKVLALASTAKAVLDALPVPI